MAVDLIVDTKSIKSISIALTRIPKETPAATSQAINRTVDYTATQTSKEVRKDYVISDKDVKSTLKKVKASAKRLDGRVVSTGRTLTLYHHFRVSPKQPAPGSRYKVKVTIKKGQRQTLGGNPKAFIQKTKGSTHVFRRKGKNRYPIDVLRSLSVPQMISNPETMTRINQSAAKKLDERIQHEINRRLQKAGAKK